MFIPEGELPPKLGPEPRPPKPYRIENTTKHASRKRTESHIPAVSDNSACALYIVIDNGSRDVKIGISSRPDQRIREIATQYNVSTVRLLQKTWFLSRAEARTWEAKFHRRYADSHSPMRGGREWFRLTETEVKWFIDWMERSTSRRAFRATTVTATILKNQDELSKERFAAFMGGTVISLFTGIIPAVAYAVTQHPWSPIAAPVGIGIICSARTKREKDISQIYGEDGEPIPKELPVSELREMNLWIEKRFTLSDSPLPSGTTLPGNLKYTNIKWQQN